MFAARAIGRTYFLTAEVVAMCEIGHLVHAWEEEFGEDVEGGDDYEDGHGNSKQDFNRFAELLSLAGLSSHFILQLSSNQ